MMIWRRVLSERRRVILPVLGALLVNVLITGVAVIPLSRSVVSDEVRAQDAKAALEAAGGLARTASDSRSSQVRAGEELKKFYADVLPAVNDARGLLYVELAKVAAEAGVQHQSSVFKWDQVEGSQLLRYYTDVTLTGEYAAVRRFLYHLETSDRFFILESVTLGEIGQRQGSQGSLEVVLRIATYARRSPTAGTEQ